jgi:pimeloyl-ACP methyl ester carboxylesterase
MREIDMAVIADDEVDIAGTLVLPAGDGPHPAVVLLCPGRSDREGDVGKARIALGRALAEALAAQGVASYRFDHRGVGATPGNWRMTGFLEHRQDAAAVLRALAAQPEVSTVGAIGYSEGALHAAWLGAHAGAAAVVLLAGTAQTGEDIYLRWAARLGKNEVPWPVRFVLRLLGRTPQGEVARTCAKLKASTGDVARIYGIKVNARMWREYFGYDPKPDLAAIQVPLLAITGDNDLSVDHDDLDVIAELVPGPVDIRRIPDLTHLLRRDPNPASPRAYRQQYRRPVDPGVLEETAKWVSAHLQR